MQHKLCHLDILEHQTIFLPLYILEAFEILNISLAAICRLTRLYILGVTFLTSSDSYFPKIENIGPCS